MDSSCINIVLPFKFNEQLIFGTHYKLSTLYIYITELYEVKQCQFVNYDLYFIIKSDNTWLTVTYDLIVNINNLFLR